MPIVPAKISFKVWTNGARDVGHPNGKNPGIELEHPSSDLVVEHHQPRARHWQIYIVPGSLRVSTLESTDFGVTGISQPVKCRATFHCGLAFRPDHGPCSSSPKFPAIHNILHKPFDIPQFPQIPGTNYIVYGW